MEKFVHIEGRTIIEIPTFGGKPEIFRYQPDNPTHDPTNLQDYVLGVWQAEWHV